MTKRPTMIAIDKKTTRRRLHDVTITTAIIITMIVVTATTAPSAATLKKTTRALVSKATGIQGSEPHLGATPEGVMVVVDAPAPTASFPRDTARVWRATPESLPVEVEPRLRQGVA
jgi:hypothetical protein